MRRKKKVRIEKKWPYLEEIDLFNPTIDNSPLVVTGDIPTPKCGGSVTHTTIFNMGRYFISRYRSAPLTY